jgi:hypothetical protein
MFTFFRRVSPKFAWLGAASILCAFAYTADAQTKELSLEQIEQATITAPYALFQYATLTGTGNTVTAALVPVVTSNGAIVYENVTLTFEVAANGGLTVASTQVIPAPPPIVSSFQAGTYVGPSNIYSGEMSIVVNGPGLASGGSNLWTLAAAAGAYRCTYPSTATWYVGSLATSPWASRIKAAGITSTAYSYGVGESADCGPWYDDILIGVSQVGKSLTIVTFTDNLGDHPTSVDQVTYTLKQ